MIYLQLNLTTYLKEHNSISICFFRGIGSYMSFMSLAMVNYLLSLILLCKALSYSHCFSHASINQYVFSAGFYLIQTWHLPCNGSILISTALVDWLIDNIVWFEGFLKIFGNLSLAIVSQSFLCSLCDKFLVGFCQWTRRTTRECLSHDEFWPELHSS